MSIWNWVGTGVSTIGNHVVKEAAKQAAPKVVTLTTKTAAKEVAKVALKAAA